MDKYISISEARNNLPTLISDVGRLSNTYFITVKGKPKAAVINFEDLESLIETAEILSIPGAYEKIKEGEEQIIKEDYLTLPEFKKKWKS